MYDTHMLLIVPFYGFYALAVFSVSTDSCYLFNIYISTNLLFIDDTCQVFYIDKAHYLHESVDIVTFVHIYISMVVIYN